MADEVSFDPRSWAGATDPVAATPPPPPPAPPAARPAAVPNRNGLVALAAGGVLVLGAAGAWLSRETPSVATTASEAAVSAPVKAAAPEPPPLAKRTLVLEGPAGLAPALASAGLPQSEASAAAQAAQAALTGKGELRAVMSLDMAGPQPKLVRLEASFQDSSGAVVTPKAGGGYAASKVEASLSAEISVVRGEMDNDSFYSSAVAAGVTDVLIPEIAKALAFDFDFQREVHAGDVFEIGFEQQKNAAGEAVGQPKLVFVSLTTAAKSRSLYWFQPTGEEGGWFDGNGSSVIRSLMRTPVDGARVSSTFGMRIHPVLGFAKMHKGIDFASPIGTPIYAAGDATVEWAAMKGPNGNLTILRHSNGWQTYYLHQSMFMPGVVQGAHVAQGQKIGEVGTTGRSTGPHLHYEVHIDGEAVDPMSVKTESGRKLDGAAKAAFVKERDRIDVSRAAKAV